MFFVLNAAYTIEIPMTMIITMISTDTRKCREMICTAQGVNPSVLLETVDGGHNLFPQI